MAVVIYKDETGVNTRHFDSYGAAMDFVAIALDAGAIILSEVSDQPDLTIEMSQAEWDEITAEKPWYVKVKNWIKKLYAWEE